MVNENNYICPYCKGHLRHYDKVQRIVKGAGGSKRWIKLSRLKCDTCNRTHRVIPDVIYPYKHYEKNIIDGVRLGEITSDILEYEDYPCETTMNRWTTHFAFTNVLKCDRLQLEVR